MKRIALVLLGAATALLALVTIRGALLRPNHSPPPPPTDIVVDTAAAAERLARAVRFPTISLSEDSDEAADDDLTTIGFAPPMPDKNATPDEKATPDAGTQPPSGFAFLALADYLAESFPHLHQVLERDSVSTYSLLYTWHGSDSTARPILLTAHLDVVPAADPDAWTHPPFSGRIADGFVWGRGTLDDKVGVLGLLEAVELLVRGGFSPTRTVYLGFGHDEEVGGQDGAVKIAERLANKTDRLEMVLDEGLAVIDGVINGLARPLATIGVAEKGYLSLELIARARGGHSSTPAADTAIGRLARAIARLESQPMPARLAGPAEDLFVTIAPELPFLQRTLFANRWLFDPLLLRVLASSPGPSATLRTTLAPTMLAAGVKDNVLPAEARAVVNTRIHPLDSIDAVEQHVRRVIDDNAIDVRRFASFASEPSTVSPTDSPGFAWIAQSIRQVYSEALVAPSLVLGGTDARHYAGLSENIYRFVPMRLTRSDIARIHGVDERISIEDYGRVVQFYAQLIRNACGSQSIQNPATQGQ